MKRGDEEARRCDPASAPFQGARQSARAPFIPQTAEADVAQPRAPPQIFAHADQPKRTQLTLSRSIGQCSRAAAADAVPTGPDTDDSWWRRRDGEDVQSWVSRCDRTRRRHDKAAAAASQAGREQHIDDQPHVQDNRRAEPNDAGLAKKRRAADPALQGD